MNNEQLIAALHANDPKAFDILFETMFPELCYFAVKLIGDKEQAKDIAASSLFTFWKLDKSTFEKMETVKSFLFTVSKNKCLNYLKSPLSQVNFPGILLPEMPTESVIEYARLETEIVSEIYCIRK